MEKITGYEPNGKFTCIPLEGYQSYVVLDCVVPGPASGPWSMVFDEEPRFGGQGMAPSPVLGALGGFAAWTVSQLAGLVHRKGMNVHGLEVDMRVSNGMVAKREMEEAAAAAQAIPMPVRKRIKVLGSLTPREHQMLENAARFCPVGQYFAGTGVDLTVEFVTVSRDGRAVEEALPLPRWTTPPEARFDESRLTGTVRCRRVRDYQSQIVVDTEQPGRGTGPWSFVADERPPNGQGVGAPPTHVVMAALAASTMSQLVGLVRRRGLGVDRIEVEATHSRPSGPGAETKEKREEGWAAGRRFTMPARKRVTIHGDVDEEARRLLKNASIYCPVSQFFMGLPLEETLIVEPWGVGQRE